MSQVMALKYYIQYSEINIFRVHVVYSSHNYMYMNMLINAVPVLEYYIRNSCPITNLKIGIRWP